MGCQSHADVPKPVKAPEFTITDLNGQQASLKDLRGKVVFLDFWATWCPPCVMSSPEVERLLQDYKAKNLTIYSISLDNGEAPVKRFLASHKISSRVFLAGDSGVDLKYQVEGIPAFFVIDQNGNVTQAWQGFSQRMPSLWRKEIDRLLTH